MKIGFEFIWQLVTDRAADGQLCVNNRSQLGAETYVFNFILSLDSNDDNNRYMVVICF